MGNLAKDTTEMDLWAFDDLDPQEDLPAEETPKEPRQGIPVPRDSGNATKGKKGKPSSGENPGTSPASTGSDSVTVNVNKKGMKARSSRNAKGTGASSGHSAPGKDFDDLDTWEETTPKPVPAVPPNTFREIPAAKEAAPAEPGIAPDIPTQDPAPESGDDREEFSPKVREDVAQGPIRPHLFLNKIERAGLISLMVLILIGCGIFYFNTISRLPTGTERTKPTDFPIKGSRVTILSAVTFWRAPVTSGPNPDTVRRDSLLIPVVSLATEGGPAAIRLFFRDNRGDLIGDAVNRTVQGDMRFELAATAGFDDLGMHAAYRTGQTKPWTIEVLEAPSENSPTEAFRKLFEMNISIDRR